MKPLLFPVLPAALLWCFIAGCEEKPVVAIPAPPVKAKVKAKVYKAPDPAAEAAAREKAMEKEIASLEAEAEKMQQEIEQEQNALDREALEAERARLEQDRAAWLEEQTAAAARDKKSSPENLIIPTGPYRDYSLFYNELSSQGRWFESTDYGYVWQPAVAASSDWRPYTAGSWASSDVGWTWVSDEPFGWATYHYGRWARVKDCGWIWVPGETWAPAWVAWRQSDQFIGWCPLPPETLYHGNTVYDAGIDKRYGISPSCYIFVAIKHFCSPVRSLCEPASRSAEVCRNTTNITRLQVAGARVDRSGPKYEWIKSRLAQAPSRYTLFFDPQPGQDYRSRIDGVRLCVFSPAMRAPWNAALRPPVVSGPLTSSAPVLQDVTPPVKIKERFRDEKQNWLAAAAKRLKTGAGEGLAERQKRVAVLENRVLGGVASVPASVPSSSQSPLPVAAVSPERSTSDALMEREAHRNAVLEKVRERQADLAGLRNGERPARRPAALVPPVETSSPAAVAGILQERPSRPDKISGPISSAPRSGSGETRTVSPAPFEGVKTRPVPGAASPAAVLPDVVKAPQEMAAEALGTTPAAGTADPSIGAEPTVVVTGEAPAVAVPVLPDASQELAMRREKALQMKADLAARQQTMAGQKMAQKSREPVVSPAPSDQPAKGEVVAPPVPEVEVVRRPAAQLQERREQVEQRKAELAARQQELAQQRQAAVVAPQTEAPPPVSQETQDSPVSQNQAPQESGVTDGARADQRAALEARRAQAEQAKEALAARQEAIRQQREAAALQAQLAEQERLQATAARQEQLEHQAAVAAAAQQENQQQQQIESAASLELARQERLANQQRELAQQAEAARQAMAVQEQRQQQQAALAEAARQQQLEKQAELQSQQEAAQRAMAEQAAAQQQREVEARQRQAEEAVRQQELLRQQEMQRQAELQQRQAEEYARQQEAARQQQMQREAEQQQRQAEEARQRQLEEERQRQAEAARQQQQREAEERQRQENERARQEAAARAADEAAKKGK